MLNSTVRWLELKGQRFQLEINANFDYKLEHVPILSELTRFGISAYDCGKLLVR